MSMANSVFLGILFVRLFRSMEGIGNLLMVFLFKVEKRLGIISLFSRFLMRFAVLSNFLLRIIILVMSLLKLLMVMLKFFGLVTIFIYVSALV